MADFYRATKIEELDRKHPGLKAFVEAQFAARTTHTQIASMLEELYGEEVSIQRISNHYRLRWWPEQNAELAAYRSARNDYRILKDEQEKDPECDAAKIIETLAVSGIVQQRERIAESDPVKLMAELRKSRELAGNIEIERGKLQVAMQTVENDKRALEVKIEQLEQTREREQRQIQGVVANAEKDPKRALELIRGIYGISGSADDADDADKAKQPAEESCAAPAVPTAVG